jgi:hypothetical protein
MIADLVEHAATAVEPAGVLLRRMGAAREVLARPEGAGIGNRGRPSICGAGKNLLRSGGWNRLLRCRRGA